MGQTAARVLIVDDDADIVDLVEEALSDEGYAVSLLRDRGLETVQDAVARLQPDCVLLDGEGAGTFGASWDDAVWMRARGSPVPVITFTTDLRAADEAEQNTSARSQAAAFSAVLSKPFDLEDLLRAVALAVRQSPFRRSYRSSDNVL